MAGSNFTAGVGFFEAVPDAEIARRAEMIRRAKIAVGGRDLSDRELDALLPPIECKRTRRRLASTSSRPRIPLDGITGRIAAEKHP